MVLSVTKMVKTKEESIFSSHLCLEEKGKIEVYHFPAFFFEHFKPVEKLQK